MKQIFVFIMAIAPTCVIAAAPSTSCPTGYVAITESYLTIESGICPSGNTSFGEAYSCLVSNPNGSCMMYAPTGVNYTDSTGTYEFTKPCPMSGINISPVG